MLREPVALRVARATNSNAAS